MALIAFALLVILALAGLIVLFVAYVDRGRDIPRADWLTGTMSRASDRVSDYLDGRVGPSRD